MKQTIIVLAALGMASIISALLMFALPQSPIGGPITDELQAAAKDLNMAPVPDRDVTFARQAQIIRELAKKEKARNVR